MPPPVDAANRTLMAEVVDLNKKLGEARNNMDRIKSVKTDAVIAILDLAGTSADTLNRAQLFDEFVSKGVPVSLVKMVEILRGFYNKMEAVLEELPNMVPRLVVRTTPARTEKVTLVKEAQPEVKKTTLASQKGKGFVGEGSLQVSAVPGKKPTVDVPVFKSPSVSVAKSLAAQSPSG